jgi:hypothetical protein
VRSFKSIEEIALSLHWKRDAWTEDAARELEGVAGRTGDAARELEGEAGRTWEEARELEGVAVRAGW